MKVTKDSFFSSEVAMNEHSRHFLPTSNQPGISWFLLKWRPGLLPSQIYRTRMYSLTLLRWTVLKQPRSAKRVYIALMANYLMTVLSLSWVHETSNRIEVWALNSPHTYYRQKHWTCFELCPESAEDLRSLPIQYQTIQALLILLQQPRAWFTVTNPVELE